MTRHHFEIDTPIWNERAVGLNAELVADDNYVTIKRTKKDGNRDYPHTYYISGKDVRSHRIEPVKNTGVKVYIVPIIEMKIVEEKKGDTVGKIVLFSGEEIEITHAQYERIQKVINDDSQYIDVGGNVIKKTAIANVEDSGEENPDNIDRSPEAVARRQAKFRKQLERNTKDIE